MTRTPLSRSKGQGHQAALFTAVLVHQAAAAVGVGTCWPWETTLPSARRRKALRRPRGRRGAGHIVAAARLQLVEIRPVDSQTDKTQSLLMHITWAETVADRTILFFGHSSVRVLWLPHAPVFSYCFHQLRWYCLLRCPSG